MRIGFDIDGVLANFPPAYEKLFVEVTGENRFAPFTPDEGPVSWNWPSDAYGYTSAQTSEVWRRIKASKTFWYELETMPAFSLFRDWFMFLEGAELYFVTARPGTQTKWQTELWFQKHLNFRPTVLISEEKGMVCRALNLDYYVDDKAENIVDVGVKSPNTKAYLLDRAYNRHMNPGGVRLANLAEFLQVLRSVS